MNNASDYSYSIAGQLPNTKPEKDAKDAPCHLSAEAADAWASGYNAAMLSIEPIAAMLSAVKSTPDAMVALARAGLYDRFMDAAKVVETSR